MKKSLLTLLLAIHFGNSYANKSPTSSQSAIAQEETSPMTIDGHINRPEIVTTRMSFALDSIPSLFRNNRLPEDSLEKILEFKKLITHTAFLQLQEYNDIKQSVLAPIFESLYAHSEEELRTSFEKNIKFLNLLDLQSKIKSNNLNNYLIQKWSQKFEDYLKSRFNFIKDNFLNRKEALNSVEISTRDIYPFALELVRLLTFYDNNFLNPNNEGWKVKFKDWTPVFSTDELIDFNNPNVILANLLGKALYIQSYDANFSKELLYFHKVNSISIKKDDLHHLNLSQFLYENQVVNRLFLIKLNKEPVGNEIVQNIATMISTNNTLEDLDFGHIRIDAKGAEFLANSLKTNTTLKKLDLAYSQIGDEGAVFIRDALLENNTLQKLHLGMNNIGAQGATSIAKALISNKGLKTLDLMGNPIGDQGAESFATTLKTNNTLKNLFLEKNTLTDLGIAFLGNALETNNSLEKLNLSHNAIGDTGSKSLGKALKTNNTLRLLNLSYIQTIDTGSKHIAEGLAINTKLETLFFDYNFIGDQGAKYLSESLNQNKTLKKLYLGFNSIQNEGAKSLAISLGNNTTLMEFRLYYNPFERSEELLNLFKENWTKHERDLRFLGID